MPDKTTQNPPEGIQSADPDIIVVHSDEDLTQQVAALTAQLAEKTDLAFAQATQITNLVAQLDEKINLSLTQAATIRTQAGELTQADQLLSGQKTTIDELTARITDLEANPSTVPVFTLEKRTYEVDAQSFKYQAPGEQPREYSVEELLKDKKLQATLVKKGVGFITEKAHA